MRQAILRTLRNRSAFGFAVACIFSSLAGTSSAQTWQGFASPVSKSTGTNPFEVIATDINLDGILDLLTANVGSSNVSILFGNGSGGVGNGTFADAVNITGGTGCKSITTGLFNADSIPDLAIANYNSDNVSIRFGTGGGAFGGVTNITVGDGPQRITTGHFNGDSNIDLVVANWLGNTFSIFLGSGTGSFTVAPTLATSSLPSGVATGKFNNDNITDLAGANSGFSVAAIHLGAGVGGVGNGTFASWSSYLPGSSPQVILVGDFNEDGISDLATANETGDSVSVFIGNGSGGVGDGTFPTLGVNYASGDQTESVAKGDFNNDGIMDLVAANRGPGNVRVLMGNGSGGVGNGTFTSATTYSAGSEAFSVATGDFNEDGFIDCAVTNYGSATVSILLNKGFGPTIPLGIVLAQPANTDFDILQFNVTFSKPVSPTFTIADLTLTGSLAGGNEIFQDPTVSDPNYRFIVRLSNIGASGTLGLSITGDVQDSLGSALSVPVNSPNYNINNYPNGDVNKSGAFDVADVALLADANLGLATLP